MICVIGSQFTWRALHDAACIMVMIGIDPNHLLISLPWAMPITMWIAFRYLRWKIRRFNIDFSSSTESSFHSSESYTRDLQEINISSYISQRIQVPKPLSSRSLTYPAQSIRPTHIQHTTNALTMSHVSFSSKMWSSRRCIRWWQVRNIDGWPHH